MQKKLVKSLLGECTRSGKVQVREPRPPIKSIKWTALYQSLFEVCGALRLFWTFVTERHWDSAFMVQSHKISREIFHDLPFISLRRLKSQEFFEKLQASKAEKCVRWKKAWGFLRYYNKTSTNCVKGITCGIKLYDILSLLWLYG